MQFNEILLVEFESKYPKSITSPDLLKRTFDVMILFGEFIIQVRKG